MNVGFIGLGSVGGKLAGTLLRHDPRLAVHDLDRVLVDDFVARGATDGVDPATMMRAADVVVTCLPTPPASRAVVERLLPEIGPGKTWIEMSTTDADELVRLAAQVAECGGRTVECPVSGGCHRAGTGNISIFASGERGAVDHVMPLLKRLGRRILYTGELGTASRLKVMTNYLATTHLVALCEALTTMRAAGIDLATTYEAIRISSGTSFVHETESQLILSGSRNVNFTLDLVQKDVGLFQRLAETHGVPLEVSPLLIEILNDGQRRYGERAQSDRLVERLEDATGLTVLADGFPTELIDTEPEAEGHEVLVVRGAR